MTTASPTRANPLTAGPLTTRADLQRAVRDLHAPLLPHTSDSGARVRLGSFGAVFPERVAELEGYARPLYGIVPLTVGGGGFEHWDRYLSGLDAGTDPASVDYWGAVESSPDQRMVEQAAIGLAMAFCPDQIWEPLSAAAKDRVTDWLHGIDEFEPVDNNWQYFRVLVSLGLERVGRPVDHARLDQSLERIETYRRGDHWYQDGRTGNVDYYIPFAFHTYGLLYVAANRLGLGDDRVAARYAERASAFGHDFVHWFASDGASIPYGRSLTYRFAMASFWGAMAWADVDGVDWGVAKGISMRHLRWWAERPISDRDGVLSVGFSYDNRRLAESYNSAGSPYWCMKAFGALAAPDDHPFWTSEELLLPEVDGPVTIDDAGWVLARDARQSVGFVGRRALPIPFVEQGAAKYDKLAYSTAFAFSGDVEAAFGGPATDSTITVTAGEVRRTRGQPREGGVEDGMTWSIWFPFDDVRVDTVVCAGTPWHGRIHRIRTERAITVDEGGFALPSASTGFASRATSTDEPGVLSGSAGCSAIVDDDGNRTGSIKSLPVNANLYFPAGQVPMLTGEFEPGDHTMSCFVFATPEADATPTEPPVIPDSARVLLDRVAAMDSEPWPPARAILASILRRSDG
ncbi:DUF2264 domain-containing protein [Ilumatobacter nonamiensis]|uniref:DUF2264 domain-containing protein n=1 Tax=Ilumatobacter nonamiensis TaxID=467093 RepID=UPI00034CB734|nr:DUF2264 domain-containing protein [Ilumatobacter nonamiensis]